MIEHQKQEKMVCQKTGEDGSSALGDNGTSTSKGE